MEIPAAGDTGLLTPWLVCPPTTRNELILKIRLLSNLDIIQNDLLSTNAILNKSFANSNAIAGGGGSMYTDEEVAHLPWISKDHARYNKWKKRERSMKRLIKLVQQAGSSLNILVAGCGNGWLAAKLATNTSGNVTGMDINLQYLQQAERVFAGLTNLEFVASNISDGLLPDQQFDIIVFAGSIEYFSPMKAVIKNALEHLTLMGQIHIMDSPLPQVDELESFQYKIIYNPSSWVNKLFPGKDPFCHIVIKNNFY